MISDTSQSPLTDAQRIVRLAAVLEQILDRIEHERNDEHVNRRMLRNDAAEPTKNSAA